VVIETEDYIHYFRDGSCLIQCSIYVVDWDGTEKFPSGEAVVFYIGTVHELSGRSTVYQCRTRFDLSGVGGLNFYFDYQGFGAWNGGNNVTFRKFLFPCSGAYRAGKWGVFMCGFN
jgi:hypothetical protein